MASPVTSLGSSARQPSSIITTLPSAFCCFTVFTCCCGTAYLLGLGGGTGGGDDGGDGDESCPESVSGNCDTLPGWNPLVGIGGGEKRIS